METTPTRSTKGGLKPLLMEVGTANMAGVLTSAIITFSGSCGTDPPGGLVGEAMGPAHQTSGSKSLLTILSGSRIGQLIEDLIIAKTAME